MITPTTPPANCHGLTAERIMLMRANRRDLTWFWGVTSHLGDGTEEGSLLLGCITALALPRKGRGPCRITCYYGEEHMHTQPPDLEYTGGRAACVVARCVCVYLCVSVGVRVCICLCLHICV